MRKRSTRMTSFTAPAVLTELRTVIHSPFSALERRFSYKTYLLWAFWLILQEWHLPRISQALTS
jgi:hypothetical protein